MLLLQCDLQSKLEKLANEELEEHSDHLWGTFISQRPQPTSQDLSTDIKALTMLLREGQEPAKAYFQLKLKDRSHPIGRLIQEFIDFFLAAYHGQKVLRDKRTAQYFLHHACHDVHSFSAELCRIQVRPHRPKCSSVAKVASLLDAACTILSACCYNCVWRKSRR
jgi:hypothetical protein